MIRKGYGYPSVFNADAVVEELLRQGKTLEDAREGGTSGCVETGAFGKEAYILTGYLNLPKILELTLNDGVDPRTGRRSGRHTGDPRWPDVRRRVRRVPRAAAPLRRHQGRAATSVIERLYAAHMPAPFLSVLIDDCIAQGPRLQRRRRALQHQLHPVRRHRHDHRPPGGDPARTCSTTATLPAGELLDRAARATSPSRTSRCASALVNRTPAVRQRRRPRRRHHARGSSTRFFDAIDGRPNARGGALPRRHAADHLPRLLRLGDRRDAGRPPRRHAALRGHLAGAGRRPPRPDGGDQVRRQDGPRCAPAARC